MTSPLLPKPAASLPSGVTRADFFTGKYCLSADAVTRDQRLVDVLRDSTRQYITLKRVRVISREGVEPIVEYTDALLKKAEVEWVAVRDESARAEARLYSYVRKTPVRVALVLPMCRIEGNAHIESKATDPVVFFLRGLEQSLERFFPITEVAIIPSLDDADAALRLAIVNRDSVRLYSVVTG